jgi:hypothetical protein
MMCIDTAEYAQKSLSSYRFHILVAVLLVYVEGMGASLYIFIFPTEFALTAICPLFHSEFCGGPSYLLQILLLKVSLLNSSVGLALEFL